MVRVGGVVVAAAISRFASLVDGLIQGFLLDPEFVRIVEADLRDGQHRNPTDNLRYFTTAFFHTPDELRAEILDAGWTLEDLLPVEGPGAFAQASYSRWTDPAALARVLAAIATVEHEPSLLGASPHLLAIGRAKAAPK